jgi:hypothetical protein
VEREAAPSPEYVVLTKLGKQIIACFSFIVFIGLIIIAYLLYYWLSFFCFIHQIFIGVILLGVFMVGLSPKPNHLRLFGLGSITKSTFDSKPVTKLVIKFGYGYITGLIYKFDLKLVI